MARGGSNAAGADRHERQVPGGPIAIAGLGPFVIRCHLQHPVNHAKHGSEIFVQADAKPVDERDCADAPMRRTALYAWHDGGDRASAMCLQVQRKGLF